MVQINFAQKTVNVKVVFYGPGMSGKTTNLEIVHQRAPDTNRGELTSISTDGDRTLFFDYMPLDLGTVAGMRTCFQCYTVPGQVYYNSTRKLVLQGVDGVIFVADSSPAMMEQNLESLRNLEENLNEYGKSLATMAHVIQFNKRDLPDAMDLDELNQKLNPHGAPNFEAVANTGQGVFPTLKALAASVLKSIMQEAGSPSGSASAPAPAAPAAGAPAAPIPAKSSEPALDIAAPVGGGSTPGAGLDTASSPYASSKPAPAAAPVASAAAAPTASAAQPASAGDVMQTAPKARPKAKPAAATSSSPSSKGAANARKTASRETVQAPRPKGGGIFTGAFVALAAAAGAAIAWVVLKAL